MSEQLKALIAENEENARMQGYNSFSVSEKPY
jgi:hypothetical protein